MNRIDQRIQEVTTLVDEGLQKHSLAHKSAIRIRELGECNRQLLDAANYTLLALDTMTSEQFSKGADKPARERLWAAIQKAREITWVRKGKP